MKNAFLLLFTIFLTINLHSQEILKYDGKIEINSLDTVKANFQIHFSNENESDSLHLFINKNSTIKSILLNDSPIEYSLENVENDLPDIKKIIIQKKFPKTFSLEIAYEYPLKLIENKTFQYNPKWIELNNFTGWFPFNRENTSFRYNLDFQIPENYKLISPGNITTKKNHWFIANKNSNDDIPVVISDEFDIFQSDNKEILFYTVNLTSAQKKAILEDGNDIINFYHQKFGNSNQNNLVITINPFSHPWSYTRKGFISLSLKDNYKTSDRLRLAHEIAHLWWSNNKAYGNGNDWLDEGFAEYSSLIWYKKYATKKEFDTLLQKYRKAYSLDLKITEVRPRDNKFVEVTYFKGAYLLYNLNQTIGNKKMMIILQKVNKNKINETSQFLKILQDNLKPKIINEVKQNIR
jgi:hypothetical protein